MKKLQIIIAVAVLIGAAFFINNYMVVGSTTLSLEKIYFQSSDPILDGDVWTIYFSEGGLAQRYFGTVNAGTTETGGTAKTEKSFSLDITDSQQKCEYPININYATNEIFSLSYVDIPLYKATTDWAREIYCTDYAGSRDSIVSIGKPAFSFDYMCIYKVPKSSSIASFNDHNVKFKTDFKMTVGNSVYYNTIGTDIDADTQVSNTVMFDDVGYVKWIGNLVTGTNCPSPAGRHLATFTNSNWRIISEPYYNIYNSYFITTFEPQISIYAYNHGEIEAKITQHNRNANAALAIVPFENAITTGTELNGNVVINLDSGVQIPTYVAYVSADRIRGLGVYQPVAAPQITSVGDVVFKTGETGYVNVGIKNIGDERGGFYTSVSCPSTVTMVGTAKYTTLEAGNDATVTIPVTGAPTGNVDITCTAKTEVLGKSATKTFNIHVDVQQICVPGTEICDLGTPKKCNVEGTEWVVQDSDRCDTKPGFSIIGFIDGLVKSLFGDDVDSGDILAYILAAIIIIVIIYLLTLILPIVLPMILKFMFDAIFKR